MKKVILSSLGLLLLLAILICYSEFKTRNFVDTFITSPDRLEEVVQGITIREDGAIVADFKPTHERYNEVLSVLRKWEVRRVVFKDTDASQKAYGLDIANYDKAFNHFELAITADGRMNLEKREFELVNGSSIEELIELAK